MSHVHIEPTIPLRFIKHRSGAHVVVLDDGVSIVHHHAIEAVVQRGRSIRADVEKARQDIEAGHQREQVLRLLLGGGHFIDTRFTIDCYERLKAWFINPETTWTPEVNE